MIFLENGIHLMNMQEQIRIYPSTEEQMESSIASAKDPELKKAYSEMLEKNTYTKIKYLI